MEKLTEEEIIKCKAYYYGMVCWIDDEIGKVLDYLKKSNTYDNTIIIFGADHGALRGECRGLGKHIFQRASQSVPLLIADPDRPSPQRATALCSNIDIPNTVFYLAGVSAPPQFKGNNLFSDNSLAQNVFATIGYGETGSRIFPARQLGHLPDGRGWPRRSCIRSGFYRLDMNTRVNGCYPSLEEADIFFVDCDMHPDEDFNMASVPAYASIVSELAAKLYEHCKYSAEANPEQLRRSASQDYIT